MPNGSKLPPDFGAKNLTDYVNLGRGKMSSAYRQLAGATGIRTGGGFVARLAAFTGDWKNYPAWIGHVWKYFGGKRYPFPKYANPNEGVFPLADEAKLSIAGDWGTGTDEAKQITDQMKAGNPDYTIHLGDVYYVGDSPEVKEHCLGEAAQTPEGTAVKWQLGTRGSFALNGNHEMYALGTAYFREFLPTLGPIDPGTGKPAGQKTSYFCLRNKYWRVIALDTGYYSTGFSTVLSFLGQIKWIQWFRKTTWFKPSCKLPDEITEWLPSVLKPDPDGSQQGLILLSHHQYYSGFDDWYATPAEQLQPLIKDRTVLWYWGHEHRMALYDQFKKGKGINAFGRCIGHGGMPVSLSDPDIKECDCILYDNRAYPNNENIQVGYNGYINLRFKGAELCVDYFDVHNTLLLTEQWKTDPAGKLGGPLFSSVHPDLSQGDADYIRKHLSPVKP